MPIYEYACAACGRNFEELVLRPSDERDVACPGCDGRSVERLISRPAASPSGGAAPRPSGGRCGPVG